ncbi:MAG: serine/threonine protein kinase [Lentisphaerae bacterium]|nr:serine/threonine protein kinase [Lentisphaerota bacterium]
MAFPEIPGYEILEQFPQGGMSRVYKARQISLDRIVVIKTLPPSLTSEYDDIKQFMFEARVAANLKHHNIIQVYDFGRHGELYYFVMEFVSGYNVADWIKRKGVISEEDTLVLADTVAKALDYAWHKAHVVHCDIKPDNIMIDSDGTVKVADLGLAKGVKPTSDLQVKETDVVTGTPNYISPEQSSGDANLDYRADMYSLGATIYHMMTGTMPFADMPPLEAMDLQITGQIADPQDINPDISTPAAYLIEKLMAKNKEDRYENWAAVCVDIARVLNNQMPQIVPQNSASTVKRGKRPVAQPVPIRAPQPVASPSSTVSKKRKLRKQKQVLQKTALILLLVLIGIVGFIVVYHNKHKGLFPVQQDLTEQSFDGESGIQPKLPESRMSGDTEEVLSASVPETEVLVAPSKFQEALTWWEENPDKYAQAIRRFQQLTQDGADTETIKMAEAQIGKIQSAQIDAANKLVAELRAAAEALEAEGKFFEAASVYKNYDGALAFETRDTREFLAKALDDKHAQQIIEQKQRKEAEKRRKELSDTYFNNLGAKLADHCLKGDLAATLKTIQEADKENMFAVHKQNIQKLLALISQANQTENEFIESFKKQIGSEVTVTLKSGKSQMIIAEVHGDIIVANRIMRTKSGLVSGKMSFSFEELELEEKLTRMGTENTPGQALAKGIAVLKSSGDLNRAMTYFEIVGEPLLPFLYDRIKDSQTDKLNADAEKYFLTLCNYLKIDLNVARDPDSLLRHLSSRSYNYSELDTLKKFVVLIRSKYSDTDLVKRYQKVIDKLDSLSNR